MTSSVLGAMPKIGTNEKKSAAITTLASCAMRSVTDIARRSKIIERLSYKPAIKKTIAHTKNKSENGTKCAQNNTSDGTSKVRKYSDSHSENVKKRRSPTKSPSVRGRSAG